MAAPVSCLKDTRRDSWMNMVNWLPATKVIFGSKGAVRRWVTGNVQRKLLGPLSTAGLEPEIFINVTSQVTGFTWDAATIVLSRVDNGYRRLKWREPCFVTPEFDRLQW